MAEDVNEGNKNAWLWVWKGVSALFCHVFYFPLIISELNIVTINVNGLREGNKRAKVFEVIKQKKSWCCYAAGNSYAAEWVIEWHGVSVLISDFRVAILFNKICSPHTYQVK